MALIDFCLKLGSGSSCWHLLLILHLKFWEFSQNVDIRLLLVLNDSVLEHVLSQWLGEVTCHVPHAVFQPVDLVVKCAYLQGALLALDSCVDFILGILLDIPRHVGKLILITFPQSGKGWRCYLRLIFALSLHLKRFWHYCLLCNFNWALGLVHLCKFNCNCCC